MLLLFFAVLAAPLDIQPRTLADGDIKMPFVTTGDAIADKINTYLFMRVIGSPAPVGKKFEATDEAKGMSAVDYKVVRNDAHILQYLLTGEWCGAYCEGFDLTYAFDPSTGRAVVVSDLVTKAGSDELAKKLQAERVRQWKAHVAKLSAKKSKEPDDEDAIAMFQGCIEENFLPRIDHVDVSYTAKTLKLTSGRCSNHASQALDEVGDVSLEVAYDKLALTPYGKALLTGGPAAPAPTSPFGQALRGTLGKSNITLVLEDRSGDGSVRGFYYYDKFRKPIELMGQVSGTTVTLKEGDSAVFKLVVKDATLDGEWSGNGRTLKVTLQ